MTSRIHSSSSTVENLRMASNKKGISIGGLAEPRNRATKAAAIAHTRKSHSQGCNNCWVYLILRDGQRKWIPVTRAHRLKVLRKKGSKAIACKITIITGIMRWDSHSR